MKFVAIWPLLLRRNNAYIKLVSQSHLHPWPLPQLSIHTENRKKKVTKVGKKKGHQWGCPHHYIFIEETIYESPCSLSQFETQKMPSDDFNLFSFLKILWNSSRHKSFISFLNSTTKKYVIFLKRCDTTCYNDRAVTVRSQTIYFLHVQENSLMRPCYCMMTGKKI